MRETVLIVVTGIVALLVVAAFVAASFATSTR